MKSAIRGIFRGVAPAFLPLLLVLLSAAPSVAQQALPPLPAPSESTTPPVLPAAPSTPPPPPSPPSAPATAPQQYTYAPPPTGPRALSSAERNHAPKYSLWLGGSLGVLIYGGVLYNYVPPTPYNGPALAETTGNFVRPGPAAQVDIGARLASRYIPYVTFEEGFLGAGRRFSGTSTTASSYFGGLGFRYLAGDVNSVSFAGDISLGFRELQLSNGQQTWRAMDWELIRLGFGADIRLNRHVTLTPMLTLSGGTFTDASGNVSFAPNQTDGLTGPKYTNGIPSAWRQSYSVLVIGCNAHVDLFGK